MVISGAIPNHLRLYVPELPASYNGRLYFILGPGLGDTVNDLRILHEVMELYPQAEPVIYADFRWQALCEEIPSLQGLAIRYHRQAPSPMSNNDRASKPYYQTFHEIIEEIIAETTVSHGQVALGGFKCADLLARKEPTLAMKARAIGLSLPADRCRPFFPLTEKSLENSGQFLKKSRMSAGNYFVIAPYTAADKMWAHRDWEGVIETLHRITGLPVLVVGHDGCPSFQAPTIREAIGLPLTLVAGLLAQARCFIGLDSGPTHLAACFDVPIVTLNPQGKFPPFLVEANSPYRWTHLTPGVYGNEPIGKGSVLEVIQKTLISPAPPRCPLCKSLPYVLGAQSGRMLYLCRCGLMYRDLEEEADEASLIVSSSNKMCLPMSQRTLRSFLSSSKTRIEKANYLSNNGPIALKFDHWSPLEVEPDKLLSSSEPRNMWWSWDAVYTFLRQCELQIIESKISPLVSNSGGVFSIDVKVVPRLRVNQDVYLSIPWGRKILRMKRSTYEQWLSWETFQKLDELEGLGWQLANEGMVTEGREILRLAFTAGGRGRTVQRLLRLKCRALWESLRGKHSVHCDKDAQLPEHSARRG